jgi:hypothetical protein
MKKTLIILLLMAGGANVFAQAKNEPSKPAVNVQTAAGWHWIASTAAELNTDKDAVTIFGADKFKALKVKTEKHGVEIKSMHVYYEDGSNSILEVNANLKAGETSKELAIDANKKIKKVSYTYKAEANPENEEARLELYGLK